MITPVWPLATSTWGEEEKAALYAVIESGNYTMGPHVAQFEREFAAYVGSPYAVMVNSGSSANLLMAQAIKWLRPWPLTQSQIEVGAEIIVPAVAWATSYFPFADLGALRFVDIDPYTLNYDTRALEAAISRNTRVIVAVHVLGNANEMDLIKTLAPGSIVVEDACEALGSTFNGRHVGTFGAMGSYSFFFSHAMSTMEGGMVVTADEELYHALLSLRSHGWTRHLPTPNKLVEKSPDAFNEAFRFILPGFNVRPGELHGAAGREQLKKLPGFLAQRRVNARAFQRLMVEHPEIRIQKEVGRSSWFGFSLVVEPWAPFDRADLLKALTEHGIEARPIIAGNFARQEVMQHLRVVERNPKLPDADTIHDRGLFIGNNPIDSMAGFVALEEALESLTGAKRWIGMPIEEAARVTGSVLSAVETTFPPPPVEWIRAQAQQRVVTAEASRCPATSPQNERCNQDRGHEGGHLVDRIPPPGYYSAGYCWDGETPEPACEFVPDMPGQNKEIRL